MNEYFKDIQARDWAFTVNNPTQSETEFYDYLKSLPNVKYFVFVKEKGHGTNNNPNGTPHYQGYIEFNQPKKFSTMKNKFSQETIGVNAHLASRKGPRIKCVEYVKKVGSHNNKKDTQIGKIYEFGVFSIGGKRNDLIDMVDMKEQGASNTQIFEAYPNSYAKHENFVNNMALEYKSKDYMKTFRLIEVIYIYGEPQVGKTRYVYQTYGFENVYCNAGYESCKWFDDYDGQDVLLLDNFKSNLDFNFLKQIVSGQPMKIPCRYKNKPACFTKVVIVSDCPPKDQYLVEGHGEEFDSLIHTTIYFFRRGIPAIQQRKIPVDITIDSDKHYLL